MNNGYNKGLVFAHVMSDHIGQVDDEDYAKEFVTAVKQWSDFVLGLSDEMPFPRSEGLTH